MMLNGTIETQRNRRINLGWSRMAEAFPNLSRPEEPAPVLNRSYRADGHPDRGYHSGQLRIVHGHIIESAWCHAEQVQLNACEE